MFTGRLSLEGVSLVLQTLEARGKTTVCLSSFIGQSDCNIFKSSIMMYDTNVHCIIIILCR